MSATEQELRQRKSTDNKEESKEESPEVIKIPQNISLDGLDEPGPMSKQTLMSLIIVYFSVFLDLMGISLVQPILPFYAEKFNASATQLGALYSSYAAMSLIASLFMGKFSDMFGRKPMIIFSLFGTCIGFLCCGLANSYGQLLGFRFLTGIFGATAPVAMAVITDLVPKASRPKYLAFTGAVISLAFIIGPGLGSGLAEFGIRVPFFVSSGLGAFGVIFALFLFKESHPTILKKRALKQREQKQQLAKDKKLKSHSTDIDAQNVELDETEAMSPKTTTTESDEDGLDDMDAIKVITEDDESERMDGVNTSENSIDSKIPTQVWVLCIVNMSTGLAFTVYTSMFALYVIDVYGLSTLSVGYITLSLAVMVVFGNIFFIAFSKYIGIYNEMIVCFFIFGLTLLIAPFLPNLWALLAAMVFGMGLAYGQLAPATTAAHASWTNVKNRGIILGISSCATNVSLIIGPLANGVLYQIDRSYPFFLGATAAFIGGFVVIFMICKWPQLRIPDSKLNEVEDVAVVDDADWSYKPMKAKRKDYMKLGKGFGVMLSQKNYDWVKYFDLLLSTLDTMFPPMHPDSLQERRRGIQFVLSRAKSVRDEFDNMEYAAHIHKI